MNIHKNARLTPHSRAELVRRVLVERQSPMSVAPGMAASLIALDERFNPTRSWIDGFDSHP